MARIGVSNGWILGFSYFAVLHSARVDRSDMLGTFDNGD